jgi:hypothetical protein
MTDKSRSRGRVWLRKRAPQDTEQGRRIRALFRQFMAPLTAGDVTHEAAALAAAELTIAAEDARARLIAGDAAAEASTVRLENACRRARLDLIALKPTAPNWWELQQQDEADAEDEE